MPAKPTRAELLSDIARTYMLEPVHDDEVTIAMMIETMMEQGVSNNEKTAVRVLRDAEKHGKLEAPKKRVGPGGRTVLAWKLKP